MEVGLERAREREKFNTEQALARGVVTVDLEYNFSKDGMPIADQVKAKRTERGGEGFKRTKKVSVIHVLMSFGLCVWRAFASTRFRNFF